MSVSIWGVGTSTFGRQPDRLPAQLAWEAISEALRDADVDDVDAAFVGTVFGAPGVAQRALLGMGLTGIPIVTVENACASGTTAFHEARQAILAGRYERVLALGIEHMSTRFDGPIAPEATDAEQAAGLLLPALYALSASRYMADHGATASDLAQVAVKNSRHGSLNPRAQRQRAVTEEEVLASRPIADPLTLYQCAGLSDAAAAAVLGPSGRDDRDVPIRGCALRSGRAVGPHLRPRLGSRRRPRHERHGLRGGRHRTGRGRRRRTARRVHHRRARHERGARAGRPRRGGRASSAPARRRWAAGARSTPPAACCPAATRSAPPGSGRSPRSPGSCAVRRASGRSPVRRPASSRPWAAVPAGLDGNGCVVTVLGG